MGANTRLITPKFKYEKWPTFAERIYVHKCCTFSLRAVLAKGAENPRIPLIQARTTHESPLPRTVMAVWSMILTTKWAACS